jgi:hypothetical protein
MQRPWNLAPLPGARRELCLTFAPLAWLKLSLLCHLGDTEIGGFGISAKNNLLYVEDFVTVKQQTTAVTVRFLDDAVADHFDSYQDRGVSPCRCGRLWIHTHPGDSAEPTSTDEHTFARSFGACDWAVIFILARSGQTYARLAFAAGPRAQIEIGVNVDWSAWPNCLGKDQPSLDTCCAQWREEFDANVQPMILSLSPTAPGNAPPAPDGVAWWEEDPWFLPDQPLDNPYPEEAYFDDSPDPFYAG